MGHFPIVLRHVTFKLVDAWAIFQLSDVMWHLSLWMYTGQIPIVLRDVAFKLVDVYGPNSNCLTSCGI
jgi:hypothetical protein